MYGNKITKSYRKVDEKGHSFSYRLIFDRPFFYPYFIHGLCLLLILTNPVMHPQRDMILNGNWIVPHFNGVPRINKPPLFYWVVAISYKIFGINEFSARLPSALAAIGTVLITYLWGKRLEDRKNGFWAGMVLMASPLFFLISRFCITDMLLTFLSAPASTFSLSNIRKPTTGVRAGLKPAPTKRLFLYFLLSMVFLVKGR